MRIVRTDLPGVLIIEPRIYRDERGFFYESFNAVTFASHSASGLPSVFVQDNHSRSAQHVLRGLHYQLRRPQGKLVTCLGGAVFDVAVDIRVGSPTFGQWTGVTLEGDSPRYLWIPPGFAHGFCVLSRTADIIYKCTDTYAADDDHGVLWSDASIGITWPTDAPIISEKDRLYEGLDAGRPDLPRYTG